MAERVRALCAFIEERYGGDAARIWREAASGEDLRARLAELPGFGEMKVRTVMTLLARQFGVQPPGIEALLPDHPTLGDVRTAEELAAYQAHKRVAEGRTARGGSRPAVRRSVFDYFRALDGLADEEREIHATVRAFVDEAIVPNVQGWWDGDTLPRELITQMGELGILGPTTPAEYGGSGSRAPPTASSVTSSSAATPACAPPRACRAASSCTRSTPTAPRSRSAATCPSWPPARSSAASA